MRYTLVTMEGQGAVHRRKEGWPVLAFVGSLSQIRGEGGMF
jgi:hypothetical protein